MTLASRTRNGPYPSSITAAERAVGLSEASEIAVHELADALEERFGGVIARDAEKIARFVMLRRSGSVEASS
jgi:hypothetical protein